MVSAFADDGASHNPCAETYCGPFPFFAVEVLNIAEFLVSQPDISFKGFIDFHSYSQLWMTPYGYTHELPPDYEVLVSGKFFNHKTLDSNLVGTGVGMGGGWGMTTTILFFRAVA